MKPPLALSVLDPKYQRNEAGVFRIWNQSCMYLQQDWDVLETSGLKGLLIPLSLGQEKKHPGRTVEFQHRINNGRQEFAVWSDSLKACYCYDSSAGVVSCTLVRAPGTTLNAEWFQCSGDHCYRDHYIYCHILIRCAASLGLKSLVKTGNLNQRRTLAEINYIDGHIFDTIAPPTQALEPLVKTVNINLRETHNIMMCYMLEV